MVSGIALVVSACGSEAESAPEHENSPRRPIWHIVGYGQSLSLGTLGVPALTTQPSQFDVMFREGVRRPPKRAPLLDGFVPLAETRESARGETGIAAAAETFRFTLAELRGADPNKLDFSILGSSAGRSGARLKVLLPPSANYGWLIQYAEAGARLARAEGQDYRYLATLMSHGETDHLAGTDRETYTKWLKELAASISNDTAALTKDGWVPPFLAYQPASHRAYLARGRASTPERPEIALAIREAGLASDIIYCVLPMYLGDFAGDVHAKNVTYQHVGKYFGRALAKLVHARESGVPTPPVALDLKEATWSGTRIRMSFYVPVPPVALDTDWISEAPNMGFDLWTKDGTLVPNAILSVSVTSPTEVTIVLNEEPPGGSRLSYAFGRPDDPHRGGRSLGPRGNLRDSEGGAYTDALGTLRPMTNWALIFEATKP